MIKFIKSRGLAFKLILTIFITTAIIFSILIYYNYFVSRGLIEQDIEQDARSLSFNTVIQIEKILLSVSKTIDNTANYLETSNFSEEELNKILKLLVEKNPEIYGSSIAFEPYKVRKDKKYYAPYYYKENDTIKKIYLGNETYNYFILDWYQIPKELDRSVWSEPYYDDGGANIVMTTYSVPFYTFRNGKKEFMGILTADISLYWLQQIVSSIQISETGYGFMLSKFGVYVTHPIKERIMNQTIFSVSDDRQEPHLRDIGRRMISGETGFIQVKSNLNEKESYLFFTPIKLNGWSIGIIYPIDELLVDIQKLSKILLIIMIIGLCLLFVVIFIISKSVTSPITALATASDKLAKGNYEIDIQPDDSKSEIGKLTRSFAYMVRELKSTFEKLKKSNLELEELNKNLELKVEQRTVELKKSNEDLNSSYQSIKILTLIGQKITSSLDLESIFSTVYENVNSLMDASTFLIMIYNENTRTLDCRLAIENKERLPNFNFSIDDKNRFGVWCFDNKLPIFMNDVSVDYKKYISHRQVPKAGAQLESIMYHPLIVENRVIGVISAQSFKKNAYTQLHLDILGTIATYTAIGLMNAIAYDAINKANRELKEAQSQLIQAEKMASLGQLTAGIAHEIKNPLNFVNNFSELSAELTTELSEELEKFKSMMDEKNYNYIKEIISDLNSNVKKINEHGKRADSIVKGMLLHSRGKSGEMQKTDINNVLMEYLNLAYHGFRAQDSTFNLKMVTELDPTMQPINVVPQNISRVFLNIINNACYSINEKSKEKISGYNPTLKVRSKYNIDKVEITIRDNGKGIPKAILDKIYNPFFTTKPTGKGTGLGLSLSFDIVVQEHKGQLLVDSVEGEYAEFTIIIPTNLK